ncbi:MAG: family 43 glycosylhydrolase [Candidatus Scatosoma sp.]
MKIIKSAAVLILAASLLSATACETNKTELSGATALQWSDGINEYGRYNNELYYSNDFESLIRAADPYIYYDETDKYFYLYSTETSSGVLEGYRSKNLANWENLGVIYRRNTSYWASACFWAPKVVRNPEDGKYYIYTCCSATGSVGLPEGTKSDGTAEKEGVDIQDKNFQIEARMNLTVLVADSPAGPFVEWTGTRENHVEYYHGEKTGVVGDEVTLKSGPVFDFADAPSAWAVNKETFEENGSNVFAQIDAYPFFDDNGDFYLYFVRSIDNWHGDRSGLHGVWGVKMLDMVTPDYETLTQLTQPGYYTVGGKKSPNSIDSATINEGPCMQVHKTKQADGSVTKKYYLTYSRSGYGDAGYSACLAVADSPLGYAKGSAEAENGGFVKLDSKYGNPVHAINDAYDMYRATGNAMFFKANGEEFLCSLATVKNKTTPSVSSRNFIIDRVTWSYNEELGYDMPHSNGPTQGSLQPAPSVYTGYRNIAGEATITATNLRSGEDANKLSDDYIVIHARDAEKELYSKDGGTTVTLEFPEAKTVRSIMVYNSIDTCFAFKKIDYVLLETEDGAYVAKDIAYPEKYLTSDVNLGGTLRPGGAAVIEFSELSVKKITIKCSEKFIDYGSVLGEEYAGIALNEIRVLGK